jgi:hypothetical protein
MTSRAPTPPALIFATDHAALDAASAVLRRTRSVVATWPCAVVNTPGDALRRVLHDRPMLLLVCAGPPPADAAAALVAALHRRASREAPALVGMSVTYDADVERALRAAGVGCYVALDCADDLELLDALLHAGVDPPGQVPPMPRGLSPPARPRLTRSPRTSHFSND